MKGNQIMQISYTSQWKIEGLYEVIKDDDGTHRITTTDGSHTIAFGLKSLAGVNEIIECDILERYGADEIMTQHSAVSVCR
jgi:hypothetical protein